MCQTAGAFVLVHDAKVQPSLLGGVSPLYQFTFIDLLSQSSIFTACANSLTNRTVSTLTVITFPIRRTIYSSSSRLFGSLTIPLRLSSLNWYWSITQSRAERLPSRYWKHS